MTHVPLTYRHRSMQSAEWQFQRISPSALMAETQNLCRRCQHFLPGCDSSPFATAILGALSWLCCDKLWFLHFYLKVHKLSCQCHHPTFTSWQSLTCTWPSSLFYAICSTQFPYKTLLSLFPPRSLFRVYFLIFCHLIHSQLKKKKMFSCRMLQLQRAGKL